MPQPRIRLTVTGRTAASLVTFQNRIEREHAGRIVRWGHRWVPDPEQPLRVVSEVDLTSAAAQQAMWQWILDQSIIELGVYASEVIASQYLCSHADVRVLSCRQSSYQAVQF